MNIFVIEARVRENNKHTQVKYLGLLNEPNHINPEWAVKDKVVFDADLDKAKFFTNHADATDCFNTLITKILEPNTSGKTLFIPPVSDIVGGEHSRRTALITLRLVGIVGDGLSESRTNTIHGVDLIAEEFMGQPYTVRQNIRVNLQLRDNQLGHLDLTIPALLAGDTYHSTYIDQDNNQVIHECWDPQGRRVVYTCTAKGNLLQRQG